MYIEDKPITKEKLGEYKLRRTNVANDDGLCNPHMHEIKTQMSCRPSEDYEREIRGLRLQNEDYRKIIELLIRNMKII